MKINGNAVRVGAGIAGGLLLVGVGGAAFAEHPDAESSGEVEVAVSIAETDPTGALSMSVESGTAQLAESGSTEEYRQFTGALPNVTVTDNRSAVDEGVFWYVTGQASDFVGPEGADALGAGNLGWTPKLVGGDTDVVAAGDPVDTVLDTGADAVGLVAEEFLAYSSRSADAQAERGSWTANADLVLKTPVDVTPGDYTSTLTLSLFEDSY